ncbi:hypothetical protein PITCH_A2030134 [uncultured Desulfobacterium sp.]|uniref:Uncharacterized protein n=1 Tax=uncultured Desulfobacterium sp. TaxID=201089 RepID=A0A445MWY5_9BACT|nr:hypothetical protein PITCH_A2030134 [uncultured Desulfobacterium sp.]
MDDKLDSGLRRSDGGGLRHLSAVNSFDVKGLLDVYLLW